MIRDYIRKLIDQEVKVRRSDILILQKQVAELKISIEVAKKDIELLTYAFEIYPKNLDEIKDEAEKAIMRMVEDNILKLESYQEAVQAILRGRS
jgi:hypothetical protein